jgi:hypothetical protein
MGSSAPGHSQAFVLQEGKGRIHGGGAIRIERIFNLARSRIIRKKNVDISSGRQRDDSLTSTGENVGGRPVRDRISGLRARPSSGANPGAPQTIAPFSFPAIATSRHHDASKFMFSPQRNPTGGLPHGFV